MGCRRSQVLFLAHQRETLILDLKGNAMIEDTIGKIESRIEGADAIKEERRQELLQLLGTLKAEVAALSKTHGEEAQSIAGFTQVSTHEATRTEQNPELLK